MYGQKPQGVGQVTNIQLTHIHLEDWRGRWLGIGLQEFAGQVK